METLGERIRARRMELGMTQDALATKADISKGFLSDVENGKRNVSADKLLDIAASLSLSLDYLMKGDETTPPPADVQIPSKLSELAAHNSLSYKQTLGLLQMKRQIVAHRSTASASQEFDWQKLYESVKEFLS